MSSNLSSSFFNINTSSDEMTTVSFCQDLEGRFTGALMPMASPLDTASQWQSLIEGLIINAIQIDPKSNLNGLYVFSWWADSRDTNCSGLLFTRLTDKVTTKEIDNILLPEGSLGLLSLSDDLLGEKMVVLAVSGYVSATTGKLRSDRIFETLITTENRLAEEISDKVHENMVYVGELLNNKLNSNIFLRQSVR